MGLETQLTEHELEELKTAIRMWPDFEDLEGQQENHAMKL